MAGTECIGDVGVLMMKRPIERRNSPAVLMLKQPSLLEDALEVLLGVDVGAGGDEGAAGELLLEVGVLAPVQLVDRQLPHRVRPRRAVLVTIGRNKRR